jgi:hypothetical protein
MRLHVGYQGHKRPRSTRPHFVDQRANPSWPAQIVRRKARSSCVSPFGTALRALKARFKMAAVSKV